MRPFNLQGHRGARGLKPENTLPSFEIAFDLEVSSIETDVHLTRDGGLVLFHDAVILEKLCRLRPGRSAPHPATRPLISTLTLDQLRSYIADRNPDPVRFPTQDADVTPLAKLYAERHGTDPFVIPSLKDLFDFVEAYAGDLGAAADKSPAQRKRGRQIGFDLELKRVPFRPESIGDNFDGDSPGLLERRVVEEVRAAGMIGRTTIRSFDHRSVRAIRCQEPRLTTAVLIAETAPVAPAQLTRQADAQVYCPDFRFLDLRQVVQAHSENVQVVAWTVNEPEDWERLIDWGVDGITTDYPDRLAEWLRRRGIDF